MGGTFWPGAGRTIGSLLDTKQVREGSGLVKRAQILQRMSSSACEWFALENLRHNVGTYYMCQIREYIGRDRMLGTFPYRPRKKRFRGNHCGFCFELPERSAYRRRKEKEERRKKMSHVGTWTLAWHRSRHSHRPCLPFNNTVLGHLYGFIQHVIRHRFFP